MGFGGATGVYVVSHDRMNTSGELNGIMSSVG
jgi:hypothetical protein